jgi:acetyl-CoA carboxylase beta subunit
VKIGPFKQETQEEEQHQDVTYEKYTDCRGIQYNPGLGQNKGLQKKCNRHVNRMACNRLHRRIKNCISKDIRKHGSQLKRVLDV